MGNFDDDVNSADQKTFRIHPFTKKHFNDLFKIDRNDAPFKFIVC